MYESPESGLLVWFWFCSVIACLCLGIDRGRTLEGFALGLFLGPLGVLVIGFASRTAGSEAHYRLEVAAALRQARQRAARDREADRLAANRRLAAQAAQPPRRIPLDRSCSR
jgi:hypothetical protein